MIRAASRTALQRGVNQSPRTIAVHRVAMFSTSSTLLPERTFWDTVHSGFKGLYSLLFSEDSRQEFMKVAEGSVINAEVLRRARFGNILTMALFHDLQDPLFRKYSFDATEFLTGVKPALTNFHETTGQLQNEFPEVTSKEERTEKLLQRMHQIVASSMTHSGVGGDGGKGITLEDGNPWVQQAKENPDSAAARLSAMVSPRVLDSLFLTTETAAMLARYQEGSATIANVALLSARVMEMDEEDVEENGGNSSDNAAFHGEKSKNKTMEDSTAQMDTETEMKAPEATKEDGGAVKMESKGETEKDSSEQKIVDASQEEANTSKDPTPVAAQIEVLYEMNQKIDVKPEISEDATQEVDGQETAEKPPTTTEEIQIWVGTFEGWLNGGPDGTLRWKITRMRLPDSEFPGLYTGGYR